VIVDNAPSPLCPTFQAAPWFGPNSVAVREQPGNLGIGRKQMEYVVFLDADDKLLEGTGVPVCEDRG
jgi:hypothetical protein